MSGLVLTCCFVVNTWLHSLSCQRNTCNFGRTKQTASYHGKSQSPERRASSPPTVFQNFPCSFKLLPSNESKGKSDEPEESDFANGDINNMQKRSAGFFVFLGFFFLFVWLFFVFFKLMSNCLSLTLGVRKAVPGGVRPEAPHGWARPCPALQPGRGGRRERYAAALCRQHRARRGRARLGLGVLPEGRARAGL